MTLLVECTHVQTADQFSKVIHGSFQAVLPHELMLCGKGGISRQGNHVRKIINFRYPLDYVEPMRDAEGRLDSPLMKRGRDTQEPPVISALQPRAPG